MFFLTPTEWIQIRLTQCLDVILIPAALDVLDHQAGLSDGPERAAGVSQLQQQDASQRQASQANKNSVVIKVGTSSQSERTYLLSGYKFDLPNVWM
jgi:hypothetical protein